ncbi:MULTISPECIES: LacI family DNA-binding transcriptional regulator [Arthrobacter]|uniref:LacI family transcriptional regulator n=1 Tax=Arthrobacter terricola TaxID=2547396 RepID=A0A4R5KVJ4_9MICC|nr:MULTISPECIES: LacI family DNA-binding transcriptional regulator [Arthrobacter]MBT8160319.1 LacI family transcriptional regulator [Arthrobacter sp. GN70]TDF99983.1 LacI family transcriptional regulator [Arthrobacter terricola]
MARSRATILDIARELGLSKTTVSSALGGSGRISEEKRELIRETAKRLGYVTNRAARSLRVNRVGTIGLFIPPLARRLAFYMDFAFGVTEGAASADYDVTLFAREFTPERAFQVDGVIAIDPAPGEPLVAALLAAGIPTVSVGRYSGEGQDRILGTLEAHHAELQTSILDHLLSRGRKRPALLAVDDYSSSWTLDTRTNYLEWCRRNLIEPLVHEVESNATPRGLVAAISAAVEGDGADALVCGAQGHAAQSQIILEGRGLVLGRDVDVASFAGAAALEVGNPLISAIDLEPRGYGEAATELLDAVVRAPQEAPVHRWFEGATVHLADGVHLAD